MDWIGNTTESWLTKCRLADCKWDIELTGLGGVVSSQCRQNGQGKYEVMIHWISILLNTTSNTLSDEFRILNAYMGQLRGNSTREQATVCATIRSWLTAEIAWSPNETATGEVIR